MCFKYIHTFYHGPSEISLQLIVHVCMFVKIYIIESGHCFPLPSCQNISFFAIKFIEEDGGGPIQSGFLEN